jgi:amino acid adenylation domain-containing protein
VSLCVTLLSAWLVLLSRWSGETEVVVGTRKDERRRLRTGPFIDDNNEPDRAMILPEGMTVEQLLKETKSIGSAELRADHVVHTEDLNISLSRLAILKKFRLLMTLRPAPTAIVDVSELGLAEPFLQEDLAGNEMMRPKVLACVAMEDDQVAVTLLYTRCQFDRDMIQRVAACWAALLEGMDGRAQIEINKLTMVDTAERERVLYRFNDTAMRCSRYPFVCELFEEQVERSPEAVAAVYEHQSLTYAELNRRANQLARHLISKGVRPDQLVGLCVERSLEMVVGLLGILKAGGAYVPLDPGYPIERLQYMLTDAKPAVLLTQESLKKRLPDTGAEVVALDKDWSEIAQHSCSNLAANTLGLSSHHLAYVIYTSGSTGNPKGVMIEHASLTNFLVSMQKEPGISVTDRLLAITTMSFDIAALEVYLPLVSGATLVLAPREAASNASLLVEMLQKFDITILQATPATWQLLLSGGWSGRPELKALCGGEALSTDLATRLINATGNLWNLYGPTETTIWSCSRRVSTQGGRGFVEAIGRPIANTQVYILDQWGQVVPIGVVGEIYIGGAGVARGYLNRPERTVERFICDPFTTDPQARIYRTGDLGRWRSDGTIEYLGRNDHQVKIRGYRIELGEIEAQLVSHTQVKEAVVIAREDIPGDKRLVAYLIPRDPHAPPRVEALREHLKLTLPEYMVPSAFVMLDRFPRTPNEKLDRRALPEPDVDAYASRQYEAPEGDVEETLARIWQDLLGVGRVGRNDNFFELGGHSLLIIQMMGQLRSLGLTTKISRMFDSPTLAALASALENGPSEDLRIPPNKIPADCETITPQMLPMIDLAETHIDQIEESVPGHARNIQDIYPLTPLQEGILFHHLLDKQRGGDTYVTSTLLSVSTRKRLQELIGALQQVINRHDILRTAVLWDGLPRPLQVVYRHASLPVEEIAIDPERDPLQQISEWSRTDRRRMDLRKAPLVRLKVAANAHGETWYAVLQIHHIVDDDISLRILISEVVAYLDGRGEGLPKPAPYRDHIAQVLTRLRAHDAEAFFSEKLGDVSEPTTPFEFYDVHWDNSRLNLANQEIESTLAKRVRLQARRLTVSPATLFHAAWALVLAHACNRDDVVFGSVLLGRLQGTAGDKQILGMFINTLPLRLQLRDLAAREAVERVRRELVELLNFEQASLAVAQRCSGIGGSAPLFSTVLNYRHDAINTETEWSKASGIRVLSVQYRTNYPIMVLVDDGGGGFRLTVQSAPSIDALRVMRYLYTAIESLVEALEKAPETPALTLSVLPDVERRQIIESFNATEAPYPQEKLVQELFEEQVERTPQAQAAVYEGQCVTYAELNRRANQLARYLKDKGIGPDQLVGICVERSVEMIVGVLGILKAGAAYLPLDPNYPAERLAFMLEDAAPRIILTKKELQAELSATQAEVLVLETKSKETVGYAEANLPAAELGLSAEKLVYVIYTSGSTGRPKGTAMAHHSMVNLIEWHRKTLSAEGRRVLQFAALSFDVAFQEIFSTLCTGGTLVLLDEWVRRDAGALAEFLNRNSVQTLFVPPLMLQSLAEYCQTACTVPTSLLDVITAGEQLRISPEIMGFFERLPGCRLHNHYGPTESHVVTALTLSGNPGEWPTLPAIGRPISNIQIYVLDRRRQPVPVGVAGEIYIGGAGVARGYLGRPDLTQERFIVDPFSAKGPARLYKTGDLGRWRADGTLEYLGRNDNQVKIRGFRIELGEIEVQLMRHKEVKEAAVVLREDIPGEKRLVAYVTSRDESSVSVEELRAHLAAALPDHMVPGAIVSLEHLPLTPSGKLDRRALPAPASEAYASQEYEAPQGAIEEAIAGIWQKLLRVERVGRRDNFFDLGGHSLLATQVIVRIRSLLSIETPIKMLFESPTIEKLSARLRDESRLATAARGEHDIEGILKRVSQMPESEVKELVRKLRMRATP